MVRTGSGPGGETYVLVLYGRLTLDDAIARVTSPIGLELNAESPEEIAVSIMAEIIMLRRKGTGERMQHDP